MFSDDTSSSESVGRERRERFGERGIPTEPGKRRGFVIDCHWSVLLIGRDGSRRAMIGWLAPASGVRDHARPRQRMRRGDGPQSGRGAIRLSGYPVRLAVVTPRWARSGARRQ
jgi:hypothetical protein